MSGSLSDNPQYASIILELVEPTESNWQYILDCHASKAAKRNQSVSLVEFPGILLPSFQSTLLALQTMQKAADIPMSDFLAPNDMGSLSLLEDIPPPVYTTSPGFSFDLKCLMSDGSSFEVQPTRPVEIERLQQRSTLDDAQATALVTTLQRRLKLIQGPPGTGKSFTGVALIKVLLANKAKVNEGLGPIICVCHTNHALDQLLEDLLENHVTSKIIRIGSRSNSECLKPLNLRTVAREFKRTVMEKHEQWSLLDEFDEHQQEFEKLHLNYLGTAEGLKYYLQNNHENHYRQLFGKDEDGYQRQSKQDLGHTIKSWLSGGKTGNNQPRSVDVLCWTHVDTMTAQERRALYVHWLQKQTTSVQIVAQSIFDSQIETKASWDTARDELDLRCLRDADVIGVTTTGLARNLNMLRRLHSKVLMCEEAGEILEAHLLTSIEHVILIGDHLQLRPQIQNYGLSRESSDGKQYALDRSLFERLVDSNEEVGVQIPYCTLETQRRMFPSISRLVRETSYPRLQDARVVGRLFGLIWAFHAIGFNLDLLLL